MIIEAFGSRREIHFRDDCPPEYKKAAIKRLTRKMLHFALSETIRKDSGSTDEPLNLYTIGEAMNAHPESTNYDTIMVHSDIAPNLAKMDLIDIGTGPDGIRKRWVMGMELMVDDDTKVDRHPEGDVYHTFMFEMRNPRLGICIQHYL